MDLEVIRKRESRIKQEKKMSRKKKRNDLCPRLGVGIGKGLRETCDGL